MAMALHVPVYTVDDLDRFPDDGNRYEVSRGPGVFRRARDMLKWRTPAGIRVALNLREIFAGL